MKKRKLSKRLLSYILCLVMVIALVPMNALTVRAEGVEHPCQHCGGTGKVCSQHKKNIHEGGSYENEPECGKPCVIIIEDHEDYCVIQNYYEVGQCEYCKGTGSDPNWTHDHHFVYVHKVDDRGENFHLSQCDNPGCNVGGNLPDHGQNCNTDGPDGACSYCGFKAEAPAHTHTKDTHHAPVAATCTNPGVVEYWDCSCGEKLDASGNVLASIEIPATGTHDLEISTIFEIWDGHHVKYDSQSEEYICVDTDCYDTVSPGYYDADGNSIEYGSESLVFFLMGNLTSYDGDFGFWGCENLTTVDLGSLTKMASMA